ncbi:MAG: TetR family transcriptional regulator [Acidimicrobiales bacterium]
MTGQRLDALLDAAEAEFADAGFATGSLRRIMREAGTDPGAVHYHFGGRAALTEAVLTRLLVPLNDRRRELLTRAVEAGAPGLAELMEALVRPDVETAHALEARSPGRARLIGAIYLRPADFVESTVAAHFAPVAEAFRPHLEAALPHVPFPVIAWRVRWCVFGTVGALLADASAPFDRPPDALTGELVSVLSAALAA